MKKFKLKDEFETVLNSKCCNVSKNIQKWKIWNLCIL